MTRTERRPAHIVEEIEATRAEIDETLEALVHKLSPAYVVDRLVDRVRSGPGEFAGNLGDAVKASPVPAVLAGLGIGWLMWSGSRRQQALAEGPRPHGDPLRAVEHRASAVAGAAANAGRTARTEAERLLHTQPFLVAAVGLAIGAAIGAATADGDAEDRRPHTEPVPPIRRQPEAERRPEAAAPE
jgi:hypothetical protein